MGGDRRQRRERAAVVPASELVLRLVTAADLSRFEEHLARHGAESGRGEHHFMPFEPEGVQRPLGFDAEGIDAPVREPGWQRLFAAFDPEDGDIRGHVDLKGDPLQTGLHRCSLGIGIERAWRGQGLGRRLMGAAIGFARGEATLAWIDLQVFGHNTAARRLYRDLGFREVGTVSDRFRIAGVVVDDVLMTLSVDTEGLG